MFRMCDPGAHVPGHLFQFHSAHVPAVAQPPQAIAEPAHVRFQPEKGTVTFSAHFRDDVRNLPSSRQYASQCADGRRAYGEKGLILFLVECQLHGTQHR